MQTHFEKASIVCADFVAFFATAKKARNCKANFKSNRLLKLAQLTEIVVSYSFIIQTEG